MSTYTESGDYWHDKWEGARKRIVELEAALSRLEKRRDPTSYVTPPGVALRVPLEDDENARLRAALNRLERECGSELLRLRRIEEAAQGYVLTVEHGLAVEQMAEALAALRTALKGGEKEPYDPGPGPEWERGPNMKDVG